jgi:hypothetical protein
MQNPKYKNAGSVSLITETRLPITKSVQHSHRSKLWCSAVGQFVQLEAREPCVTRGPPSGDIRRSSLFENRVNFFAWRNAKCSGAPKSRRLGVTRRAGEPT